MMAATTATPERTLLSGSDSSFRFLAAACRWPDGMERRAAILSAAEQVEDWEAVLEHGVRHRVMPLIANALRLVEGVPPELATRASVSARRDAFAALVQASEAMRIGSAFDASGIDWLTFKGPALAMLAYGNLGLKAARDLDLLVDRRRIDQCFAIMADLGYVRVREPDSATPEMIDRHFKDYIWVRKSDGLMVELHTRFFDTPALVPGLDLGSPRELVSVGLARPLPTLARAELLVYLAAHGARTSWYRIKWLADFAALLAQSSPEDIAAAQRRANDAGIEEIFSSAQLLSAELFGARTPRAPLPPRLERRASRLAAAGARELMASHEKTYRQVGQARGLASYLAPIGFARSWGYRRGELVRLFSDPRAIAHGEIEGWRGWVNPAFLVSRFCLRQVARLMPMRR